MSPDRRPGILASQASSSCSSWRRRARASFSSTSGSGAQAINVNLSGAGGVNDPLFVGVGTTQENVAVAQSPGTGTMSGDSLTGEVTYTYTPAQVPEPSTWAMMGLGFAGLGYAAIRRK